MEIPRGRRVSKAKIFKGKYEAKLEIPGQREVQTKKPFLGKLIVALSAQEYLFNGFQQTVKGLAAGGQSQRDGVINYRE